MNDFETIFVQEVNEAILREYKKQENDINELQNVILDSLNGEPEEKERLENYYENGCYTENEKQGEVYPTPYIGIVVNR